MSQPPPGSTVSIAPLRRTLRGIGWLRSAVYLAIVIKRRAIHDPWLSPQPFARQYDQGPDSWGYESTAAAQRLICAAQLLDRVAQGRRFRSAMEIGCAEGTFTELLAERCEELIAVDFVPLALKRARRRRDWGARVKFQQFDLMRDALSGNFDLIALMDVLDYFPTRGIKAACEKVLGVLPSGGYLLITGVKQADIYDAAWWSRWIIRGGPRIKRYLAEHPLLKLAADTEMDTHVLAVFEKT
jgi:SAM-dependent methyltransferase